jgi:hypothetical protein
MPTQNYPLRRGAQDRLEVSYDKGWKNITLRLDGDVLGAYASKADLKEPQTFSLADGSTLKVVFKRGLDLRLNGQALPGSTHDPLKYLNNAYGATYFIGGLNLLVGIVKLVTQADWLPVSGPVLAVMGIIYLALGYGIQRRSLIALVAATVLYTLDTVLLLVTQLQGGSIGTFSAVRIVLLIALFQGFQAISALKKEATATTPSTASD